MFRTLFRWLLRAIVIVALLFVIAVISDYYSHRVAPGTVLVVRLTGPVVERGRTNVVGLFRGANQTPLNVLRRAMAMASQDPRIEGLALKVTDADLQFAQAQEIVELVRTFARTGKWTAAYLESAGEGAPGNLDYVVAAAARELTMMPRGELNLVGVQTRDVFIRGLLDWLQVRPQADAIGAYKSIINMFMYNQSTPPQREENQALVQSLYEQLVGLIAAERNLTPDAVKAIVDRAPLNPAEGMEAKLVNRLEYEDQFTERIRHWGGHRHELLDYGYYARPRMLSGFSTRDKIAVVYGTGEIDRGSGGFDPLFSPGGESMGADSMRQAFKQVREDDSVRAVVFRINSPGGSVIASELVRHEVELTAAKKPLVVSMSSYAASGGYMVASPARKIFADPGTITGSIGVAVIRFNVAPFAQRFGVNTEAVSRGQNVNLYDEFSDLTPQQTQLVHDKMLGTVYHDFVQGVADTRHLSYEQVDRAAQGRVWTGAQALGLKLVDQLGGIDNAIEAARAEAGLAANRRYEVVELPEQPTFFEQVAGGAPEVRGALSPAIMRVLTEVGAAMRSELARHGAAGLLYCSKIPVM